MTYLTLIGTRNGRDFWSTDIPLTSAPDPYGDKREAAIQTLGERYVLDRARYVPRGEYSQHESHGADVAATWAKAREKMSPALIICANGEKA